MLKEVINEKWKCAFKNKDEIVKSALNMVKARILTEEKSGKHTLPLNDDIITSIIVKEVKELKETQTFYTPDDKMYQELQQKIECLSEYLPKEMSVEEVKNVISTLLTKEQNKGKLIGLTVKEIGNRFDKSKIAQLVSEVMLNNM